MAAGEASWALVYGGRGALGSACVRHLRAKNWVKTWRGAERLAKAALRSSGLDARNLGDGDFPAPSHARTGGGSVVGRPLCGTHT